MGLFEIQANELDNYIKEISSGNEEALKEFYNNYGKYLYSFILSIVKSRESVEDVLQDVLTVIATHDPKIPILNSRAWLFKVIKNLSIKKLKEEQAIPTESLSDNTDLLSVDNAFEDIENSVDQIEALKCLDRIEQQCVIMCVFGQMKLPQVAEIMDMPYNKVCNKYDYAVRKLRKYYEERRRKNERK